jgi:translation initiation factor 4A
MLNRNALRVDKLKILCLDEADQMLDHGFRESIYAIFQLLPPDIQVALFSATLPPNVLELTKKFMRDPLRILVRQAELTLEGIKQFYVAVEKEQWKLDTLCDIFETISVAQSVIFCNSRRKVEWLTQEMNSRDFTVSGLVRLFCFCPSRTLADRSPTARRNDSG